MDSKVKKQILSVVENLMTRPCAKIFIDVFAPDTEVFSNYYNIIDNPMDLNTIKGRIESNLYGSVDNVTQDINTIVSNSLKFFGSQHEVTFLAQHMIKMYEKSLNAYISTSFDDWHRQFTSATINLNKELNLYAEEKGYKVLELNTDMCESIDEPTDKFIHSKMQNDYLTFKETPVDQINSQGHKLQRNKSRKRLKEDEKGYRSHDKRKKLSMDDIDITQEISLNSNTNITTNESEKIDNIELNKENVPDHAPKPKKYVTKHKVQEEEANSQVVRKLPDYIVNAFLTAITNLTSVADIRNLVTIALKFQPDLSIPFPDARIDVQELEDKTLTKMIEYTKSRYIQLNMAYPI